MKNGWETDEYGSKLHHKDGLLHSINDEPAAIWSNGDKHWYKDGKFHRDNNKPAVICPDGFKSYWINGKRHRTNGPAVEYANGNKRYYINGIELSEKEFNFSPKSVEYLNNSTNKDYPHTCPNCKLPAYVGLNSIDCSNCKGN